jgi:hypothetical protein
MAAIAVQPIRSHGTFIRYSEWPALDAIGVIIRNQNKPRVTANSLIVLLTSSLSHPSPRPSILIWYSIPERKLQYFVDSLLHFLPPADGKRLETEWKQYQKMEFDEYEDSIRPELVKKLQKYANIPFEANDFKVRKHLEKLYAFAK